MIELGAFYFVGEYSDVEKLVSAEWEDVSLANCNNLVDSRITWITYNND